MKLPITRHQQLRRETRDRRVAFVTHAIVGMSALGAIAYALARLAHALAAGVAPLP